MSLVVVLWGLAASAAAEDYVFIPDMSRLRWQMVSANGVVYLRNLDEFEPTFLSCCYNYYIDTTTPIGKSIWAVLLLKISTAQPLWLLVADKTQPGPITYLGNW